MSARTRPALVAAALAVLAAAPTRAAAQPACVAGTLSTYIAPAFQCTIGNWLLVVLGVDVDPRSQDAFASVVDPATAMVTPFTGTGADGSPTFGLAFTDYHATTSVSGSTTGHEVGIVNAYFVMRVRSLAPNEFMSGMGIDYQLNNAAPQDPSTFYHISSIAASAGNAIPGASSAACIVMGDENRGTSSQAHSFTAPCGGKRPSDAGVAVRISSLLGRSPAGTQPMTGTVVAQMDRLTFFVGPQIPVPEPTSVALVATGLAALGATALRRRR